jgi:hypothetical protein
VAAPIRVGGLDAEEAEDLVQALAARGLVAHLIRTRSDWHVEVREAHEETERLLADVRTALDLWVRERGRPAPDVTVGEPDDPAPDQLNDALKGRVPRSARPR